MTLKQKLLFTGIVLLAVFFRFYLINKMPGGLFPDEAANGLDINLMQQGQLQPFYERGNGREALFFYMEWASAEAFGKGPWQAHVVSATVGLLAVLLCFFVTYRLFLTGEDKNNSAARNRAVNIALLAMFLMAVSSWHTVLSRTAFRANMIALFAPLTVYFLLRAYQSATFKTRMAFAALTGAAFALGFYTYIAYRIMVPIMGMIVLWPLLASLKTETFGQNIKKYWPLAAVFAVSFIVFIFPIAKYFYQHPGSFVGRSGQVSVFNPDLYTVNGQHLQGKPPIGTVLGVIGEVAKVSMLGYFTQGDLNWRHNVSGFPFLSPVVSPFFAAGLLFMLIAGTWYLFAPVKRAGYWKYYVLMGWFFGMLVPVITTAEGIPHGLRSIGTIPPVFIISAWALYRFAGFVIKLHNRLHEHWPKGKTLVMWGFKAVVVCFAVALISQTYFLYFVYAYNSPENFYFFRSDLTTVSHYVVDRCSQNMALSGQPTKQNTFLILDKFWLQTTDYITSDQHGNFRAPCNVPYTAVDPGEAWKMAAINPGEEVIFTQSSVWAAKGFKEHHPETYLAEERRNKFGQVKMAIYRSREDMSENISAQPSEDETKSKLFSEDYFGFSFRYPSDLAKYEIQAQKGTLFQRGFNVTNGSGRNLVVTVFEKPFSAEQYSKIYGAGGAATVVGRQQAFEYASFVNGTSCEMRSLDTSLGASYTLSISFSGCPLDFSDTEIRDVISSLKLNGSTASPD